jgi:nucleoside-diphosphate-sugar epimerase
MRVLITGGYGCIGAWICRNLIARNAQVWIYDLNEDPRRLRLIMSEPDVAKVAFVQGDVADQKTLQDTVARHRISHIIHLAGLQVPTCRANPILGAQVNVVGTLAVFEAVRLAGEQIERLVYASSAAVFGAPDRYPAGPLPDDVKLMPSTHYCYFKCCNEGNAAIYYQDFGLSSIGLRPWTVYGVGRDFGMTSEPTKAIKSLALGRPYHITYGGWQDLQYANDVAQTFIRCLERPYRGAKSYNLRGAVVNLPTFHLALCEVEPAAQRLVTFGDKQIAIAYDLDDSALQRDLGPMPKTPLQEGIRLTLEMFRRLAKEGRLDTADLEAPKAAPVTLAAET